MKNFEPTFEIDFFKKIRTPYKPKPLDLAKLKNKWKGTGYCFLGNLMIKKQDWELINFGDDHHSYKCALIDLIFDGKLPIVVYAGYSNLIGDSSGIPYRSIKHYYGLDYLRELRDKQELILITRNLGPRQLSNLNKLNSK
jgi:hypothetical protein